MSWKKLSIQFKDQKEPYLLTHPAETPQKPPKLPIVSIKHLLKNILYVNQRPPEKSPTGWVIRWKPPPKLPSVSIKPLPKRILYINQRSPENSPLSTRKNQKEPCVSIKDTQKRALYVIERATENNPTPCWKKNRKSLCVIQGSPEKSSHMIWKVHPQWALYIMKRAPEKSHV